MYGRWTSSLCGKRWVIPNRRVFSESVTRSSFSFKVVLEMYMWYDVSQCYLVEIFPQQSFRNRSSKKSLSKST